MIRTLLAVALAASPALAAAQVAPPQLSLDHRTLVRCSAAFAIVTYGQDNGNEAALAWPAMGTRGREFFVRALVQVMDEAGLSREQVEAAVSAEAQDLAGNGTVDQVMPVCLTLLPDE